MGQGTSSSLRQRGKPKPSHSCKMDGSKRSYRNRLADDVKKLTHAASKWRLGFGKKKVATKLVRSVSCDAALCSRVSLETAFAENREDKARQTTVAELSPTPVHRVLHQSPPALPLADLLSCLGQFVRRSSAGLSGGGRPSESDVVGWVKQVDRALHLNGWTTLSFLLESHVVFVYMLMRSALELYPPRDPSDLKELFYICLYISYTYNANEISYPLRPFLVKGDRVAFWEKCIQLSLSVSDAMLRLNQDGDYYESTLRLLVRAQ